MARSRNIKPGFYTNEDLAECSVWARYIFPGLWMLADREGRLEDRPKWIKGQLLPFDTVDVEPLLRELSEKLDAQGTPFIVRYQNSDGRFIQISKFSKHQSPHYSEKPSVIKPPVLREITPDISTDNSGSAGGINNGGTSEHSGNSPPIKRGSQPPDSLIHRFSDSPNPDSLQKQGPPRKARSRSNGENKFELPDWVPRQQWDAWIEARTKKRNAPTPWAMELAVAKLEELRDQGHHPAAVLAQSAFKGYAGLFAPKD